MNSISLFNKSKRFYCNTDMYVDSPIFCYKTTHYLKITKINYENNTKTHTPNPNICKLVHKHNYK